MRQFAEGDRRFFPPPVAGAAAIMAGLALYCWFYEGGGVTLLFTLAITGAILAFFTLLTRRVLFAALATAGAALAVVVIAWRKQADDDMVFHAWDIVEFFTSPATALHLWTAHRLELVLGVIGATTLAVVLWRCWRVESPQTPRLAAALLCIVCASAAAIAGAARPERAHLQYFWFDLHLASFYASFREAGEALARGGLVIAGQSPAPKLADGARCASGLTPPHILLIHEESITSPDLFPGLAFDRSVMPFFNSDDGHLHRLRVETYGGASWLTEFSVLAGVSTHAFGSMRNFVQVFTRGKLHGALPQALADCGYHDIMFTPWDKAFMAVSRFYESIGFKEIDDRRIQGNQIDNERDRFFFANVLNRIARHIEVSTAPLFIFVETMSAHWPYDVVYMPEVDVPGGGPGTPPQMSEYLRRLAMVKMDDEALRRELAQRFPGERFLLVRYGDHHPTATLPLLGKPEDLSAEAAVFPDDSIAYQTFYAINGVGYAPPAPPQIPVVDVGYLGAILLTSAGLPLPPAWVERIRLMNACEGHFWTCADHGSILAFNRQLIDSGQLP